MLAVHTRRPPRSFAEGAREIRRITVADAQSDLLDAEAGFIFNTNLYSKKNQGPEWTRVLNDAERRALVEYLKTL